MVASVSWESVLWNIEKSALFFVIWGGLGNIICYDLLLSILYTLPPPDIRAHCRQTGIPWSGADCELAFSPQASTAAHYSAKWAKDENGKLQNKTGCTVTFSDCVWELRLNLTFHLFPEWLWLTQMLSDVSSCDEVASWISSVLCLSVCRRAVLSKYRK